MQKRFNTYIKRAFLFAILCTVLAGTMLTSSCKDEDEGDNGLTVLNSYGPMPVARGAELRFIGVHLDKVTSIVLPGNIEIPASAFTSMSSTMITITVPQNAVEGLVVLKAPQGDITTKTPMGFSEPIILTSFAPATIKFDEVLTITGDYLNLIKEVIFTDRVTVAKTAFISQSRTELKLKVPATAQTGKIAISNGADDPIIIYSATNLAVTLPGLGTISPNPVKAGTALTITGTNLDLVKSVLFGGNKSVTAFTSQTLTQIVVNVPADAQDDTLRIIPASGVKIKSATPLVLVVPTVSVTPTSVKNNADITVTGTNLDLVDKVTFGGGKQGTIKAGGTPTQIMVTVPADAINGVVDFTTKATKTVHGPSLTLIDPEFTSFAPTSSAAKTDIVITGTDLDLVTDVIFTGPIKGIIGARSLTEMTVTVPVGAKTGKITLVTLNGSQVKSATDFIVLANLPNITGFLEPKGTPGKILTILGTNMSLIKVLIFPGNVVATEYGLKSDTKVEVYVPVNVLKGIGTISLITYEGDEGITPPIFIGGTDPVKDPSLMINDFEVHNGHDLGWDNWGGNVELGSDASMALSGNYMHGVNAALSGWAWIWGCNHDQLPKVSVPTTGYVLKMDVNVTKPLPSGANFQLKMGGNDMDLGQLGILTDGTYSTIGWITMTWDLEGKGLPAVIPASGDWGMICNWGGPMNFTGVYIDNIRFEKKSKKK
jgi:hypothetical protein